MKSSTTFKLKSLLKMYTKVQFGNKKHNKRLVQLFCQACFDVREGPRFWKRMAVTQNQTNQPELLKWLSTHPTHGDRAENLEALLPQVQYYNIFN